MMQLFKSFVAYFESEDVPLVFVFLTFLASVMLRTFWEHTLLVHEGVSTEWGLDHAHYIMFYLDLGLSLTCLFYVFTRERIGKILRMVFPTFIVLSLVPLIDRILSVREVFQVTYYFPDAHPDILKHFFLFFGPLEKTGATPGMRFEVAFILIMIAAYIFIKTRQLWKACACAALSYVIIFAYLAIPCVVAFMAGLFHTSVFFDTPFAVGLALFLFFPLALVVFFLASPEVFRVIFRDMRWMRLGHYLLLVALGAALSAKNALGFTSIGQEGFLKAFFLVMSVSLGWGFCVISNNWADEAIDRVSNPQRPSVTGAVPKELYRRIGWWMLAGSLVYALAVNEAAVEVMSVFMGAYFIYSMPPIRFKRVTVLSKFVIGFNSLLMFMLGFMFWAGATTVALPVIVFFLLFFTLAANFIDIKDYEGDKAAGIKTLPVVLGLIWSKRLIGLFFILTYLMAYEAFMLSGFFVVCLAGGLVQFFLINRKSYDERPILMVHLVSLLFIMGVLVKTMGRMM